MKKRGEKEELTSLTMQPHVDFTIEELELRLETDPLLVGSLFNVGDSDATGRCSCKDDCTQEGCEHTCSTCYGIFIDVSDCPDYNCTPVYCACVSD